MRSDSTRQAFGDVLLEIGAENENVYVIDCDISRSMKTVDFARTFPNRHLNVGIAEQNAAGVAAGLAAEGFVPIISTYAVFGSMRMCEQIRTSICYPKLNVKIACSHGGITPGNDGVTHQGIEDLGIMRSIPNMTIVMGADYTSTKKLVKEAVAMHGPVYLRFTRDAVPGYYGEADTFQIGKGKLLREGSDLSIITFGEMLHQGIAAADILEGQGISVELIDMHTLKPLDAPLIESTVRKTGKVITVEDHNILNGLGSAVAEVMAEMGAGKLKRIGLKDCFAESGKYHELLQKYGMNHTAIVDAAKALLKI